jgi:hypothetical protein
MPKTYPAVSLLANHGRRIAIGAGVLVAVLFVALFAAAVVGPVGLAGGLLVAIVVWGGMRVLAELVEVVAETLLPR